MSASDRGPDSLPAHTSVIVRVHDVNDNSPHIRVNTLTSSAFAEVRQSVSYYTAVTLARPSISSSLQIANRSFTYHHLTCGISSLLHSVNLIVFTVLLVHLILRISPHHSHHLHSHHLSLPRPFTPDLKLISFTNPFLHSHSYSFRTDCLHGS